MEAFYPEEEKALLMAVQYSCWYGGETKAAWDAWYSGDKTMVDVRGRTIILDTTEVDDVLDEAKANIQDVLSALARLRRNYEELVLLQKHQAARLRLIYERLEE